MARPKKTEAPDCTLAEYIAANEGRNLERGVVLVRVTFPDQMPRDYMGTYSGFAIDAGPMACYWSDGSKQDS